MYKNGLFHMTKVAAMPIYGKNLQNRLLPNQKFHDLETWYGPWGLKVYKCYMSLVLRKPVFGVSDQVRHKPGCTATENG